MSDRIEWIVSREEAAMLETESYEKPLFVNEHGAFYVDSRPIFDLWDDFTRVTLRACPHPSN